MESIIININNDLKNKRQDKFTPILATINDIPDIKKFCYPFWGNEGIYPDEYYDLMINQQLSYIYKLNNEIIALCLLKYEKKDNRVYVPVICVKEEFQGTGIGKSYK